MSNPEREKVKKLMDKLRAFYVSSKEAGYRGSFREFGKKHVNKFIDDEGNSKE